VRPIVLQATLTAGSPTISGLPSSGLLSTANMLVGMPVCLHGQSAAQPALAQAIPAFTTLSAVGSTTATMTANATVSGSAWLVFGLEVHVDFAGYGGQGVQPGQSQPGFNTTQSQWYMGMGYMLAMDEPQYGGSKSGLLTRLGGYPFNAFAGMWGDGGWGNRGGLTSQLPPTWPRVKGSVRVDYAGGYGIGALSPQQSPPTGGSLPSNTTIPNDLTDAVNRVANLMRTLTVRGAPVKAESLSDQAYKMIAFGSPDSPEIGGVRELLSHFAERSI
jgi:hypothetical protein